MERDNRRDKMVLINAICLLYVFIVNKKQTKHLSYSISKYDIQILHPESLIKHDALTMF